MSQVLEHKNGRQPTPWGFWATVGFSLVIGATYVFIQTIVVGVFMVAAKLRDANFDVEKIIGDIESNGFLLATATCVSSPFVVALTVVFAKARQHITVRQYLCLHRVGWKDLGKWALVIVLFVICHDTLIFLLHKPIVPDVMINAYKTAQFAPLLLLALIVVAPVSEEIFFRGFLFKGIESSKLGPPGAIIITALAWSVMHLQYNILGIAGIFVGGLLLGLARLRSNSIYPSIFMHALQNVIATIEVVIYIRITANAA